MNIYYIYLVTIKHPKGPYYYVGQHGWNGVGEDLSYHGSCYYRASDGLVNWDKSKCSKWYRDICLRYGYESKVLEWCNKDNVSDREVYWIDFIMTLVGSKLRNEKVNASPYLLKYKSGTCLNGRLTGTEHLQCIDARAKAIQTRIQDGSLQRAQRLATEAARKPEARAKQAATRRANATKVRVWYDGVYKGVMNNPQLRELLGASKGQVSTLIHRAKVKGGSVHSDTWNVKLELLL